MMNRVKAAPKSSISSGIDVCYKTLRSCGSAAFEIHLLFVDVRNMNDNCFTKYSKSSQMVASHLKWHGFPTKYILNP